MRGRTLTLPEIRRAEQAALLDRLGPDGTLRFLQQYESGAGDYTQERHVWLDGLSIEEVVNGIKAGRQAEESESSAS